MARGPIRLARLWVLTLVGPALAAPEFSNRIQGGYVSLEGGGTALGADVFAEVGLTSNGVRTLEDRTWLMLWDARLAARGGVLLKSLPVNPFGGGAGSGNVEAGRRFGGSEGGRGGWAGYLGVGLAASLDVLSSTQVPFSRLYTLGSVDDVGGLFATESIRIAGGASLLREHHAVLVTGFVQSQLRLPSLRSAVAVYNGGGVHLRWDIQQKLIGSLDYFVGVSPRMGNSALGYTQQAVREQVTASFRYLLDARSWLGAEGSLSQIITTTRYGGPAQYGGQYGSQTAPSVTVGVQYGLTIGGPG